MVTKKACKEHIVKWIKDNPGYVYSQFTFIPEYEGELLPSVDELEAMLYNIDEWSEIEHQKLDIDEQARYPGATHRRKFTYTPLEGNLIAHTFENKKELLYVVVHT